MPARALPQKLQLVQTSLDGRGPNLCEALRFSEARMTALGPFSLFVMRFLHTPRKGCCGAYFANRHVENDAKNICRGEVSGRTESGVILAKSQQGRPRELKKPPFLAISGLFRL